MKKMQAFSFHLHWITLCCFLLPFFYNSCADEKKPDKASFDSTSIVVPVDTTLEDSISSKNTLSDSTTITSIDTSSVNKPTNEKDEFLSEKIIEKYPILKLILTPHQNTYTGLATIINTIPFISLFAAAITFLLLLICLLSKLIDKHAQKTFLIVEICATAFLFIARPYMMFDYEILWGYWICLLCISTLIIIDTYIIYKQKREEI